MTIAGLGHWPRRFPADLFMREHGDKKYEDGYRSWPSNAAIFLPGGMVPKVGDRSCRPTSGTLQYMVDQARATAGRGGRLARDDLADFHSRYEAPVKVIHQTLRAAPAMAAGVSETMWSMDDVVTMIEEWEATQR